MAVTLTPITILLGLAINGVFTGIGVAVGTWIANHHIIARAEKINKHKFIDVTNKFGNFIKRETQYEI